MLPVIGRTFCRQLDTPSPWHVHERCVEFIYCSAGECDYESCGRKYQLGPRMMFVSRPDEEHRQIQCPKGFATYYMLFRAGTEPTSRWFGEEFLRLPRLFACDRAVETLFGQIFQLLDRSILSVEREIRLQTLSRMLLLAILDSARSPRKPKRLSVFGKIAAQMREHPEEDFPTAALVAASGISRAAFMSGFKDACGYPPHTYLLRCRVEAAKTEMQRNRSVKAIAERFGFSSPQHFARTFVKFTGVSPRKWLAFSIKA